MSRRKTVPTDPDDLRQYLLKIIGKEVDLRDDTEILQQLPIGIVRNEFSKAKTEMLRAYYKFGQTLKNLKGDTRKICSLYGFNSSQYSIAKKLVERYPNYEECEREYLAAGCPALATFLGTNLRYRNAYNNNPREVRDIYAAIQKYLDHPNLDEATTYVKSALEKLTLKLIKYFPVKNIYDDQLYFKHSFCVGCGVEAGNKPFNIVKHDKYEYVWLPFCDDCYSQGMPYNKDLVIRLYGLYALQLEEYLSRRF